MSQSNSQNRADELEQVGLDTHVEVDLIDGEGHAERMAFDLVRKEFADLAHGFLGADSPLAKAILGKRTDTRVPYTMGDIQEIHIVQIRPAQQAPTADAASRRQTMLDNARRKAERTSAEMFAASYDGKWGDYEMGEDETPSE